LFKIPPPKSAANRRRDTIAKAELDAVAAAIGQKVQEIHAAAKAFVAAGLEAPNADLPGW